MRPLPRSFMATVEKFSSSPFSLVPEGLIACPIHLPTHLKQSTMSSTGTIRGMNKGYPVQKLEVPKRPAGRKGVSLVVGFWKSKTK